MKVVKLKAQYIERSYCYMCDSGYGAWSKVDDPEKRIQELLEVSKNDYGHYQIGIEYHTMDGEYAGFYPGISIQGGKILGRAELLML